jgi:uncharacterized membrane protein
MKRTLKALHEIGSVGVMGSLATCLVLAWTSQGASPAGYLAVRQGIAAITGWVLVPSLALTIISGLLAIVANPGYIDAGWAWIKALLGVSMFEGSLLTIAGSARRAAELAAQAAAGAGDPLQLAQVLRTERIGSWVLLAVSAANIVLAIWRPRLRRGAPETPGREGD